MPQPKIVQRTSSQLIGTSIEMSLLNNKTGELWKKFIPRLAEIQNRVSDDKISMQIYPENYYQNFSPENSFVKWASVQVDKVDHIPEGLDTYTLPAGLYAVFQYKGSSNEASLFFQYIFSEWIPSSKYSVDHRPHFEVLGEKYKNNDPNSEEEIWIPIKEK